MSANTNHDFVRPAVLAARYGVTPRTVLNWIAKGLVPAVRFGKVTRVPFTEAVAIIEGIIDGKGAA